MTLDELNKLQSEARACDSRASTAERLRAALQAMRVSDKPLMVAYKALRAWDDATQSAIEGVINEFGVHLLRIVELRQEAYIRKCKTEADAHRAALGAFVTFEEPKP